MNPVHINSAVSSTSSYTLTVPVLMIGSLENLQFYTLKAVVVITNLCISEAVLLRIIAAKPST